MTPITQEHLNDILELEILDNNLLGMKILHLNYLRALDRLKEHVR